MKKLFVAVALLTSVVLVNAQSSTTTTTKETKTTTKTTQLKDHVCTAACKDGKHVYAHGEKGHKCTDACKKKS